MPHIVFTAEEIAAHLLEQSRGIAASILQLSDLNAKPLDPGESPDARRHKIAKLGKQLAETFQQLDAIIRSASAILEGDPPNVEIEPSPQAN